MTTTETAHAPLWSEEFAAFDLVTPSNPDGMWYSNPDWGGSMVGAKDPAGQTWDANPNQRFGNGVVLNPFTVGLVQDAGGVQSEGNALTVHCYPSSPAQKAACGYNAWGGTIVQNADKKFFTVGSYLEVRALFRSNGQTNLWPAIWFFAASGIRSGAVNAPAFQGCEVDLVEPQGRQAPGWVSMHMRQSGDAPNPDYQYNGSSDINGASFYGFPIAVDRWAVYGFDWQTTGLAFYLNGAKVAEMTNPTVLDFFNQAKMGFRVDYTLQSDTLSLPVSVSVDYIREWPNQAASVGYTPAPTPAPSPAPATQKSQIDGVLSGLETAIATAKSQIDSILG